MHIFKYMHTKKTVQTDVKMTLEKPENYILYTLYKKHMNTHE